MRSFVQGLVVAAQIPFPPSMITVKELIPEDIPSKAPRVFPCSRRVLWRRGWNDQQLMYKHKRTLGPYAGARSPSRLLLHFSQRWQSESSASFSDKSRGYRSGAAIYRTHLL